MKNIENFMGVLLIVMLTVSCDNGKTENNPSVTHNTPKALKEDKLDIKSYSRSGDLTEELYQELVDKTPALEQLEEDLYAIKQKPNALSNTFYNYDSKSTGYYSSANYKSNSISDSLLRMKINKLIATSSKHYSAKTADLNALLKEIAKNAVTLNDQHLVMKIVLTLPLIEKYQDEHKPDKSDFIDVKGQQEHLIERVDSITPNF
ncbi:MAG: hypothetical protein IPP46_20030 [Bacteroidetes bacterium]|nr:hypothetical protein [Bacteroidota bacterium]